MKDYGNMENCKDMKSITLHDETIEVYIQVLNVNFSSYAADVPKVQS